MVRSAHPLLASQAVRIRDLLVVAILFGALVGVAIYAIVYAPDLPPRDW